MGVSNVSSTKRRDFMQTHVSEVAAIRAQIAAEHMAAKLGLEGLNTGTARHSFITARLENIGVLHGELQNLVGDGAIALVAETMDAVPDIPTRSDVLAVLRRELNPEEVEPLCNALQEAWQAIDLIKDRFGDEQVRRLLFAPSSVVREVPTS
jgi:hypothetical protein